MGVNNIEFLPAQMVSVSYFADFNVRNIRNFLFQKFTLLKKDTIMGSKKITKQLFFNQRPFIFKR